MYFGEPRTSKPASSAHALWELLSILLSRGAGVLNHEVAIAKDGWSCQEQLLCCVSELDNLAAVLKFCCSEDLPSSDKFILKVVEKSLALLVASEVEPSSFVINQFDGKFLIRYAHQVWDATQFCKKKVTEELKISVSCLAHQLETSSDCFKIFMPSSKLPLRCLQAFSLWLERIPLKRARWLRLVRSMESLAYTANEESQQTTSEANQNSGIHAPETWAYCLIFSALICKLRGAGAADDWHQIKFSKGSLSKAVRVSLL
jgi:hypothetical protein